MKLEELGKNWEALGEIDPLWAILSVPELKGNKWTLEEFLETGVTEVAEVLRFQREIGIEPKGKALDFGCGVGRLTQAMADHFDEVVGVDIAESMVSRARQINRHGSKVTYFANKRDDLSLFERNSFDFIYSRIVLQHMRPSLSLGYIQEFIRVLRPQGCLVFQVTSGPVPSPAGKRSFRDSLRDLTPAPLLKLSRRLRGYKPDGPTIEIHGLPITRVVRTIYRQARIIDIRAEQAAGPGWLSFRYCVTKDA